MYLCLYYRKENNQKRSWLRAFNSALSCTPYKEVEPLLSMFMMRSLCFTTVLRFAAHERCSLFVPKFVLCSDKGPTLGLGDISDSTAVLSSVW